MTRNILPSLALLTSLTTIGCITAAPDNESTFEPTNDKADRPGVPQTEPTGPVCVILDLNGDAVAKAFLYGTDGRKFVWKPGRQIGYMPPVPWYRGTVYGSDGEEVGGVSGSQFWEPSRFNDTDGNELGSVGDDGEGATGVISNANGTTIGTVSCFTCSDAWEPHCYTGWSRPPAPTFRWRGLFGLMDHHIAAAGALLVLGELAD